MTETNKQLTVKCSLNQFKSIDQGSCWIQSNDCPKSDMLTFNKLHLVEKGTS